MIDKRGLSERDICTKFITPALRGAGWYEMLQIREEVSFTKGRIIVRGKLVARGKAKRADYILFDRPVGRRNRPPIRSYQITFFLVRRGFPRHRSVKAGQHAVLLSADMGTRRNGRRTQ